MDARELFKIGFLLRCAEEGLTAEQAHQRMEKAATATWYQAVTDVLGGARNLLTLPVLGSLPLGFVGGALLADAISPSTADPDELKRQELITAYQRASERAKRMAARTQYRMSQAMKPPRLPSTVMGG